LLAKDGSFFRLPANLPDDLSRGETPMRTEIDRSPANIQAIPALEDAVRLLAEELKAARREGDRQGRRLRLMALALVAVLAVAGWSVGYLAPAAQAQVPLDSERRPVTAEERVGQREKLLAELPADTRRQLGSFEREVDWLTRYMQTWDEGTAGAVVALMLYRMSHSMDTMPSMEQQMRSMSVQMGALPAIVAELNQINAKMTVITGTLDSTMGRAGRMMPWMPFSP
jgi:hypothetical protein